MIVLTIGPHAKMTVRPESFRTFMGAGRGLVPGTPLTVSHRCFFGPRDARSRPDSVEEEGSGSGMRLDIEPTLLLSLVLPPPTG